MGAHDLERRKQNTLGTVSRAVSGIVISGLGYNEYLLPTSLPRILAGLGLTFWMASSMVSTTKDAADERQIDGMKLNLRDRRWIRDTRAIVVGCLCFTCQHHSRAYINHLLNVHEMLAQVLLYLHNLHHYLEFFRVIRKHIQTQTFDHYRLIFAKENQIHM